MKDRNMNQGVEGILADKKRIAIPIMTHPGIELLAKLYIGSKCQEE